ncbi:17648_t:CDS:2 [Dentiscutata erythropus]|uniref:17648_t:CDS:1 n=1 Tax=Dentiscutata erythropus TaxID=1348616 RepID=A0A9N9HC69_9GLOM|nr:17648_t:CDS:2 [Dentiscutata erythropus]
MRWFFPIQFGTPSQTLNISIDTKSNLFWVVSELCMIPNGNACNNRTTNFFNTSLSNTSSIKNQEFTTEYINRSKFEGVLANDTIIINNQSFEQITFGLPKNIKIGNNTIPDTITGQIGLMPYQSYILDNFADKIVGIALSMNSNDKADIGYGGSIIIGGINTAYIKGNDENNIVYHPLPQFTKAMVNVTNIYINNKPINLSGSIWFSNKFQSIRLDDNSANIIANGLPGGSYSNGAAIVDCDVSPVFDLSFEIANRKWRLPSNVIPKDAIDGTNKCESIITGSANNGIAPRNNIDYGPVEIGVQFPIGITSDHICLTITDQEGTSQAFSLDSNLDSDGFYYLGHDYHAYEGSEYNIDFYSGPPINKSSCSGYHLIKTPPLMGNVATNPWKISLDDYSVGMKVKVPSGTKCMDLMVHYIDQSITQTVSFNIDELDDEGYYHIENLVAYEGSLYGFYATDNSTTTPIRGPGAPGCTEVILDIIEQISADFTNNPWAINF